MKKLPKKYAGVLFSLYASAVMVLIVSGVLVALNTGIDAGYPLRLLKASSSPGRSPSPACCWCGHWW